MSLHTGDCHSSAGAPYEASHAVLASEPVPSTAHDFETQCLPHRKELFAAALRLARQPDDAHDLVQETFMRAYLAWSRFQPGTNCRAWLYRILFNGYINLYRKRRRYHRMCLERPEEAVAAVYGQPDDHVSGPEQALLDEALGDEVIAALAALDREYLQVVVLADLRGERYRDIAEALGVPIGTVMSRLFRARRQLEKQLSQYAATGYGIRRAA